VKILIVKISLIISLFSSLLLVSCSSNTVSQSKYYLLHNQQQHHEVNKEAQQKKKPIIVQINELPRYLNQANLVMQLDQHQLHYSHHHRWAEPLHAGFSKALLTDLNNNVSNRVFLEQVTRENQEKLTTLVIAISHFHTTNQSKVTLSGSYWFNLNDKENVLPVKQKFQFDTELQQDGYAHSVEKMRELIRQLSVLLATGK